MRGRTSERVMTIYRCTNCGHVLAPGESPCSKCGDSRRTVDKLVETAVGSSVSLRMTITKIRQEVQKNWPLLAVLAVGDAVSTIPAYFLSGWASVAVTLCFIVFSTVVGYYAITRVIRTTIEHR